MPSLVFNVCYHGKRIWNYYDKDKAISRNIPTKILNTIAQHICIPLTDCINSAISNGVFPNELKLADVTSLHKKSDPNNKTNYWLINILP